MKFRPIRINQDQRYAIGIDDETNTYCVQAAVGAVATSVQYFQLTREEFLKAQADSAEMNRIAFQCKMGGMPERRIKTELN